MHKKRVLELAVLEKVGLSEECPYIANPSILESTQDRGRFELAYVAHSTNSAVYA